jgi:hypothetical protein
MGTGLTVRDGRDRYLAENALSTDSYTARKFRVPLGPIRIVLPNPGLLPLHDIHHVVTGYDTGIVGEAEISAFELRTGCRSRIVLLLCVGAIFFGMFLAPRRVLRSWRRSRGLRSLYHADIPYDALLGMDVTELRRTLGIPAGGLADQL